MITTTTPTNASVPTARLRLTQRGRVVITAIVAAPLVVAAIAIALNGGGAFASGAPVSSEGSAVALQTELVSFTYVTVAAGESLWDVAEAVAPTRDPRDVIVDIVSLNQLPGDSVQAGQRLALPSGY